MALPGGPQRGSISVFDPSTATFSVRPAPVVNPDDDSVRIDGAGEMAVRKVVIVF